MVFYSSVITMMHGPTNPISFLFFDNVDLQYVPNGEKFNGFSGNFNVQVPYYSQALSICTGETYVLPTRRWFKILMFELVAWNLGIKWCYRFVCGWTYCKSPNCKAARQYEMITTAQHSISYDIKKRLAKHTGTQNYSAKIALLENIEEGKYIASFSNFSRILMKPSQNGRGGYKSNEAQEDWRGRCWEARVGVGDFELQRVKRRKMVQKQNVRGYIREWRGGLVRGLNDAETEGSVRRACS